MPLLQSTPTVEITINLYGSCCAHYCTHVAAVLRNPSEKTAVLIEYDDVPSMKNLRLNRIYQFEEEENSCRVSTIKLYSNKKLSDFIEAFNKEFKKKSYSYFFNNCANAVKFLLDFFFPNERCYSSLYTGYQLLFCVGFIGSLGLLNCLPAPPSTVVTPADVYKKAKLLSLSYGNRPDNFELIKDEITLENKIKDSEEVILEDDFHPPAQIATAHLEQDFRPYETLNSTEIDNLFLNRAVEGNKLKIAKELLEQTDVNITFEVNSCEEKPSIFYAVECHSTAMLKLLLEHKADVNKGLKHGLKTESGVYFAKGTTLLMYAACCDYDDDAVLQLLCKYGANINAKSESGSTALHWALTNNKKKHIEFFGSKHEVNWLEGNNKGENPFAFAVRIGTKLTNRH